MRVIELVHKAFRRVLPRRLPGFRRLRTLVRGKRGLEIGGPSPFFDRRGLLPLYRVAARVDGCNFAPTTLWEGTIREGMTYRDGAGYQYIHEATELSSIPDSVYDFVLSCNSLEHIADPLRAIQEWSRVLVPDGILIIVAPRKESNFDHRRPITTFEHLREDYLAHRDEGDMSHLEEVLELHDLSRDPPAGGQVEFAARCRNNLRIRSLHHHVFDRELLLRIFAFFHIREIYAGECPTDWVVAGRLQM